MKSTKLLPWSVRATLCVALIVILGTAGTIPAFALQDTATESTPFWFSFHVGRVADEYSTNVTVTLRDQKACGGQFQVFAGGDWSFWDTPEEGDWMGVGEDTDFDRYTWNGDLVPGTYYVRLGSGAHADCALSVSGEAIDKVQQVNLGYHEVAVESPTVAIQQVVAVNPEPQQMVMPNLELATAALTTDEMVPVPGVWMPVTSNVPTIFSFQVGRVPDEYATRVSITLYAEPYPAGEFQVFSGSDMTFDQPEDESWFGHSYEEEGDRPAWYGELVPGSYFVRVEPQGMRNCLLSISGEAVTY